VDGEREGGHALGTTQTRAQTSVTDIDIDMVMDNGNRHRERTLYIQKIRALKVSTY
jgi:hypothetical protein